MKISIAFLPREAGTNKADLEIQKGLSLTGHWLPHERT